MGTRWRTTTKKIWKRIDANAIFISQQLQKILETEESVTGVTEVLQKTEVIPESIGLVNTKAQAGVFSNLVLSSFTAFPHLNLDLDKSRYRPTFAALIKLFQVYGKTRAALKSKSYEKRYPS